MNDTLFDPASREAQVLRDARLGLSPKSTDLDRIFNGLAVAPIPLSQAGEESAPSSFAEPVLGGPMTSLGPTAASSLFTWKALLATSALTLTVGFGAGFGVSRSIDARSNPKPSPQVVAPLHQESAKPAEPTALVTAPVQKDFVELATAAAEPRLRPRVAKGSSMEATELTAYDEINTVRNAQGALKSGEPLRALGLVRELTSRSAGGALLAERQVIEVLALCELGRSGEARRLGEALLRKTPDFAYGQRLRASCAFRGENSSHEGDER
jgi:hypothetical protein